MRLGLIVSSYVPPGEGGPSSPQELPIKGSLSSASFNSCAKAAIFDFLWVNELIRFPIFGLFPDVSHLLA